MNTNQNENKTIGFYGGKFTIPHKGHRYLMIQASTIVDELHVVISHDPDNEQELFENTTMEPPSITQRVRWWEHMTKDLDHVHIHAVNEPYTNTFDGWEHGANEIKKAIGKRIDKVFSGEPTYGEYFDILYPDAEHVVLDRGRERYPISSTIIREQGVLSCWDMIPKEVRQDYVKKIVIVGTESNGKTTLLKNLASIYDTDYVEEYGRTMYEDMKSFGTLPEDFAKIVIGHTARVHYAIPNANKILFVDTEAYVTKNFLVDYENIEDDPVVNVIAKNQDYDLWLFLEPDVTWVDDGSRIFGDDDMRNRASDRLKSFLDEDGIEYVSVSGDYHQRLVTAIEAVDDLIDYEGSRNTI